MGDRDVKGLYCSIRVLKERGILGKKLVLFMSMAAAAVLFVGAGCLPQPYEAGQPDSLFSEFVLTWDLMNSYYACFAAREDLDWDQVFGQYRSDAMNLADRSEMIQLVLEMTGELGDMSIALYDSSGSRLDSCDPGYFCNWDRDVWGSYMLAWGGEDTLVKYAAFRLDPPYDSIGYMYISSLGDDFDLTEFFYSTGSVMDCSRLILDLRMCDRSGQEENAQYAVGRFTKTVSLGYYRVFRTGPGRLDMGEPLPVYAHRNGAWQFTDPTIVLCGRHVQTGAEALLLLMKSQDQVTVIGDTSAGYANPAGLYNLTGGFTMEIPRMMIYSPESVLVFNRGIPPDTYVQCGEEDFSAGIDPVLDAALEMATQ